MGVPLPKEAPVTDTSTAATPTTDHDGDEPETDPTPSVAVAVVAPTAEQALAATVGQSLMPGVPSHDEFVTLAMTARILAMSGAAPELVRDNPYVAFHVAMVGRDLGISPSASLSLIDVIDGKKGPQISLSPQLLNGQVERLGLGLIVPAVRTLERAVALAIGPGGHFDPRCSATYPEHRDGCECLGIIGESEFTWEDARMAGLVGPSCQPGVHDPACLSWTKGKNCNQGYRTYPKRMLWWRAAGFCADDWFPTASLGLYSPEALGAVVDIEGRPIDPSTVELPEGYQPVPKPPDPREALLADDVREGYRTRLLALPPEAFGEAKKLWAKVNDEGIVFLPILDGCKVKHTAKIEGLIASFEDRAKKGEWGEWDPPAPPADETGDDGAESATTAPDSPPPGPDAAGAADTPEAADEPTAPPPGSAPDAPVDQGYQNDMLELDALISGFTAEARAEFTRRVADEGIAAEDLHDEAKRRRSLALADELNANPPKPACAVCGTTDDILVEHKGVRRCGNVKACTTRLEAKASENVADEAQGKLV